MLEKGGGKSMPPFAVTQAGEGCLSARLFVRLPLSYFDRLTHACVDIQRCPLATPTRARYVNCQAVGEGRGECGRGADAGQSRTKIKQTNGKHKRGWIHSFFFFLCLCRARELPFAVAACVKFKF